MTATALAPRSQQIERTHVPGVTQLRVIRSEWTKFWSLRSTIWTLLSAVGLMIGLGALVSAVTASQFDKLDPAQRATFNPVSISLSGITFAQLAVGVLGVLLIGGEYSTGMIRATMTVVPRRLPVLWAKAIVYSAVVFVLMLISAVAAFFLGQALLGSHGTTIDAPGALRSVFGAALFLTVGGLIAFALGALLRNTAAAISTFVAVFLVIPPLAGLLPASVSDHLVPYLPSVAGGSLYGGSLGVAHALTPWTGFAVFCLYALVLVGAAAVRLRRTDA